MSLWSYRNDMIGCPGRNCYCMRQSRMADMYAGHVLGQPAVQSESESKVGLGSHRFNR